MKWMNEKSTLQDHCDALIELLGGGVVDTCPTHAIVRTSGERRYVWEHAHNAAHKLSCRSSMKVNLTPCAVLGAGISLSSV